MNSNNSHVITDEDITEWDVKGGRGTGFYEHKGNQHLRALCHTRYDEYKGADKGRKTAISREIVKKIQTVYEGRFLDKRDINKWYTVDDKVARTRVGQIMRECPKRDNKRKHREEVIATIPKSSRWTGRQSECSSTHTKVKGSAFPIQAIGIPTISGIAELQLLDKQALDKQALDPLLVAVSPSTSQGENESSNDSDDKVVDAHELDPMWCAWPQINPDWTDLLLGFTNALLSVSAGSNNETVTRQVVCSNAVIPEQCRGNAISYEDYQKWMDPEETLAIREWHVSFEPPQGMTMSEQDDDGVHFGCCDHFSFQ